MLGIIQPLQTPEIKVGIRWTLKQHTDSNEPSPSTAPTTASVLSAESVAKFKFVKLINQNDRALCLQAGSDTVGSKTYLKKSVQGNPLQHWRVDVDPKNKSKVQFKTASWKPLMCSGNDRSSNVVLGDTEKECWWDVDGSVLTCPYKSMVLDASGGANEGTHFIIFPKHSGDNQRWLIENVTGSDAGVFETVKNPQISSTVPTTASVLSSSLRIGMAMYGTQEPYHRRSLTNLADGKIWDCCGEEESSLGCPGLFRAKVLLGSPTIVQEPYHKANYEKNSDGTGYWSCCEQADDDKSIPGCPAPDGEKGKFLTRDVDGPIDKTTVLPCDTKNTTTANGAIKWAKVIGNHQHGIIDGTEELTVRLSDLPADIDSLVVYCFLEDDDARCFRDIDTVEVVVTTTVEEPYHKDILDYNNDTWKCCKKPKSNVGCPGTTRDAFEMIHPGVYKNEVWTCCGVPGLVKSAAGTDVRGCVKRGRRKKLFTVTVPIDTSTQGSPAVALASLTRTGQSPDYGLWGIESISTIDTNITGENTHFSDVLDILIREENVRDSKVHGLDTIIASVLARGAQEQIDANKSAHTLYRWYNCWRKPLIADREELVPAVEVLSKNEKIVNTAVLLVMQLPLIIDILSHIYDTSEEMSCFGCSADVWDSANEAAGTAFGEASSYRALAIVATTLLGFVADAVFASRSEHSILDSIQQRIGARPLRKPATPQMPFLEYMTDSSSLRLCVTLRAPRECSKCGHSDGVGTNNLAMSRLACGNRQTNKSLGDEWKCIEKNSKFKECGNVNQIEGIHGTENSVAVPYGYAPETEILASKNGVCVVSCKGLQNSLMLHRVKPIDSQAPDKYVVSVIIIITPAILVRETPVTGQEGEQKFRGRIGHYDEGHQCVGQLNFEQEDGIVTVRLPWVDDAKANVQGEAKVGDLMLTIYGNDEYNEVRYALLRSISIHDTISVEKTIEEEGLDGNTNVVIKELIVTSVRACIHHASSPCVTEHMPEGSDNFNRDGIVCPLGCTVITANFKKDSHKDSYDVLEGESVMINLDPANLLRMSAEKNVEMIREKMNMSGKHSVLETVADCYGRGGRSAIEFSLAPKSDTDNTIAEKLITEKLITEKEKKVITEKLFCINHQGKRSELQQQTTLFEEIKNRTARMYSNGIGKITAQLFSVRSRIGANAKLDKFSTLKHSVSKFNNVDLDLVILGIVAPPVRADPVCNISTDGIRTIKTEDIGELVYAWLTPEELERSRVLENTRFNSAQDILDSELGYPNMECGYRRGKTGLYTIEYFRDMRSDNSANLELKLEVHHFPGEGVERVRGAADLPKKVIGLPSVDCPNGRLVTIEGVENAEVYYRWNCKPEIFTPHRTTGEPLEVVCDGRQSDSKEIIIDSSTEGEKILYFVVVSNDGTIKSRHSHKVFQVYPVSSAVVSVSATDPDQVEINFNNIDSKLSAPHTKALNTSVLPPLDLPGFTESVPDEFPGFSGDDDDDNDGYLRVEGAKASETASLAAATIPKSKPRLPERVLWAWGRDPVDGGEDDHEFPPGGIIKIPIPKTDVASTVLHMRFERIGFAPVRDFVAIGTKTAGAANFMLEDGIVTVSLFDPRAKCYIRSGGDPVERKAEYLLRKMKFPLPGATEGHANVVLRWLVICEGHTSRTGAEMFTVPNAPRPQIIESELSVSVIPVPKTKVYIRWDNEPSETSQYENVADITGGIISESGKIEIRRDPIFGPARPLYILTTMPGCLSTKCSTIYEMPLICSRPTIARIPFHEREQDAKDGLIYSSKTDSRVRFTCEPPVDACKFHYLVKYTLPEHVKSEIGSITSFSDEGIIESETARCTAKHSVGQSLSEHHIIRFDQPWIITIEAHVEANAYEPSCKSTFTFVVPQTPVPSVTFGFEPVEHRKLQHERCIEVRVGGTSVVTARGKNNPDASWLYECDFISNNQKFDSIRELTVWQQATLFCALFCRRERALVYIESSSELRAKLRQWCSQFSLGCRVYIQARRETPSLNTNDNCYCAIEGPVTSVENWVVRTL